MTDQPHATARRPHPGLIWAGLTLGLALILVALLMLFILPSLNSGPHDLTLGVVGEAEVVAGVDHALQEGSPGAFDIKRLGSTNELREAISNREVVGGFDLTGKTVDVFVASADSTAVSGTIDAAGTAIADSSGSETTVTDVVPLPAEDPTGVGIGGLAFPLVFGGIVPAVAFRSLLPGRRGWILAGLLGFSLVGGLTVAVVLRFVFGSIEGSVLPVAAAVGLGIAALALPLAGLDECFGGKGFTVAAMTMMFVGNPFAGIATGAQWLPAGVALIGQSLPPGAAGTLVRAVAYFDGAGGASAALTLLLWVLLGLGLWFAGPRLRPRSGGRVDVARAGQQAPAQV